MSRRLERINSWLSDHWVVTIVALAALIAIPAAIIAVQTPEPHATFCTYTLTREGGELATWALIVTDDHDTVQGLQNGDQVQLPVPPSDMTCVDQLGNTPFNVQRIGLHDTPPEDNAP